MIQSDEDKVEVNARAVFNAITTEVGVGRFPTRHSLEAMALGLTQKSTRAGVATLLSRAWIEEVPTGQQRGPKHYLRPTDDGRKALRRGEDGRPPKF